MSINSEMWDALTSEIFSDINDDFINNFRAPGSANKFVAWDPYEKSTRYFKFLLYNVSQQVTDSFFDSYKGVKNTDLGNPLQIRFKGCNVNADYFSAIEEWEFLHNSIKPFDQNIKHVIEIGGGFGRTCHTLLSLCPNIESYSIIDLVPMLALSQHYLSKVVPDSFKKINFIASTDIERQNHLRPDLVINIDSFQEMPNSVIDDYMQRIICKANFFYSKNAVGKYRPESIGLPDLAPEKILDAFELGRCKDVIDIFDDSALDYSRTKYLNAYNPEKNQWTVINDAPMLLFPYFQHALFARNG